MIKVMEILKAAAGPQQVPEISQEHTSRTQKIEIQLIKEAIERYNGKQ